MQVERMRVAALVLALMAISVDVPAQVTKQSFGKTPDGTPVEIYTIKSGALEARITTYGGIVTELKVPDKNGKAADVVLGHGSVEGHMPNQPVLGALIGRYRNPIAGGHFAPDGKA